MGKYAVGTDIGGSHISCAVVDLDNESVRKDSMVRKEVNNQAEADEIISIWCSALETCFQEMGPDQIKGIGFAMPGPFDYENGIALFKGVPKYQSLYGIHIADRIREILSLENNQAIRFINDATAFAIGEAWMGKAAGYAHSVYITLGTGFGSAFLENSIPVVDRDDVPPFGCVWHLPFRDGISDDYFSTRWIIKQYDKITGNQLTGVKEIADLVPDDLNAKEIFSAFGENLGDFLAPWLRKFHSEILIIGGNISGAYSCFGAGFENSLKDRQIQIEIRISELMENAAMIGSARLLDEQYWQKIMPLLSKM